MTGEGLHRLWHKIVGPLRPSLVIIPPGVWHGVVSLGPETALLLNLVDKAYAYDAPDHRRLPPDTEHIPYRLV
jgi:dTDP-4-dehydrorhamnose 3,5-epimerase